ncbi:MAG: hypothetical protein CL868_14885 [Cytophagaceae bacterium]|nr:hypothetical protein [Cytophagaceae bacterium]|tara:strand:- start:80 stop:340 length:261 start_codon:yes stop_codon:yes gene_type:complete
MYHKELEDIKKTIGLLFRIAQERGLIGEIDHNKYPDQIHDIWDRLKYDFYTREYVENVEKKIDTGDAIELFSQYLMDHGVGNGKKN